MTTSNHPTCTRCGATNVTWATAKSGARYLANLSHAYENGARYLRGPHAKTCDEGAGRAAQDAARAERVAETLRVERLRLRRAGASRWVAMYGRDAAVANMSRLTTYAGW